MCLVCLGTAWRCRRGVAGVDELSEMAPAHLKMSNSMLLASEEMAAKLPLELPLQLGSASTYFLRPAMATAPAGSSTARLGTKGLLRAKKEIERPARGRLACRGRRRGQRRRSHARRRASPTIPPCYRAQCGFSPVGGAASLREHHLPHLHAIEPSVGSVQWVVRHLYASITSSTSASQMRNTYNAGSMGRYGGDVGECVADAVPPRVRSGRRRRPPQPSRPRACVLKTASGAGRQGCAVYSECTQSTT